jgi:hypothetical protein
MRSETSGRSGLQGYRPICGSQRTINNARCPAVKTSELDQDQPAVSRNLHKNRGETRGDVSIRGLWTRGTDCIIDVRVTDTDARAISPKTPPRSWKLTKRRKKEEIACLEQRRTFTPFVVSTDGQSARKRKPC